MTINIVSLLITLVAVLSSSLLAWRALGLARNANHFPVVVNLLAPHRSPTFKQKEDFVVEHMQEHDQEAGFEGLPEPIRSRVFEVAQQYHMLGYVMLNGLADGRLLTAQVGRGAIRVWLAVEPFVQAERRIRGGEESFMNSFERFVESARMVDAKVR